MYCIWSFFHVSSQIVISKLCVIFIFCVTHYNDVLMGAIASRITSFTIVYSTVYSRRRSKKTSKLRVTGLCEGNSPVTGEFPAQRASNAENASIWWRHHVLSFYPYSPVVGFCCSMRLYFSSGIHMMTSSNGNIFRVTGHLCGKFTGPRWISRTKASDAELWCFLWFTSE